MADTGLEVLLCTNVLQLLQDPHRQIPTYGSFRRSPQYNSTILAI